MLLPIPAVEVGVGDRRSTVDHFIVADINAHMGHGVRDGRVIGVLEKHQITGPGILRGHGSTHIIKR